MALIKCPECGKEISDKAPACPHCGCPVDLMEKPIQGTASEKVVSPLEDKEQPLQPNSPTATSRHDSSGRLIAVLMVVGFLVIVLAAGIGVYSKNRGTNTSSDSSELSASNADSGEPNVSDTISKENNQLPPMQPILLDQGWSVVKPFGNTYVIYGVKVVNPNDACMEYAKLKISVKNSEGKILTVSDQTFGTIAPNDTIFWGSSINLEDQIPDSVEFSTTWDSDHYYSYDTASTSDFVVSNLTEIPGDRSCSFTGEIKNNTNELVETVIVSVLYKQGNKIVGGMSDYVDNVMPEEATPFEANSFMQAPEHDSVEVVVYPW